jgi:2,3-bisphosphoglycerate-independent phosphoglycerate mutase
VTVPQRGSVAEDFQEKLQAAQALFRQGYEFVHVHSKGPDIAAHRKDPLGKKTAIEEIDSVLGPLLKEIEKGGDLLVVITGDHATPSNGSLIHSGEAIPLLIVGGQNVLADNVAAFNERAVTTGGLGKVYGVELMPLLLNLTDRVRLHGVRHQRREHPYWPHIVDPFTVVSDE